GLPCSVHTYECYAVPALDIEADIFEDSVVAVLFRYISEFGDNSPAWLRLRERKVDRLFFFRDLDTIDLFEFLDAALDLLGLGRGVAKTVDEYFELFNAFFLSFVRRFELFPARCLGGQILIVVPRVEVHLLVPELDDLRDGSVKEITVVRNQNI